MEKPALDTEPPTNGDPSPEPTASAQPEADGAPAGEGGASGGLEGGDPARPHRRRRRRRRRPVETVPAAEGEPSASPPAAEGDGAPPDGGAPQRPILRLRNRRRRRPRLPGAPAVSGGAAQSADAVLVEAAAGEGVSGEAAADIAQPERPPGGPSARPRRRRRRRPGTAPANGGEVGAASPSGEGRPDGAATPGRRPNPRNRRPREGAPREGAAPGAARLQSAPRERAAAPGSRDRGPRGAGPGDRRDRDPRRREGRRDEGARRPERKLYNLDSVIDRGFEDVEEEEAGTRRVPWTIIKRTVADQVSRKPMSASYVLQRDGAETEFPSLGAARSAVNKTIVHPEKLTLSRAEHAAAKK